MLIVARLITRGEFCLKKSQFSLLALFLSLTLLLAGCFSGQTEPTPDPGQKEEDNTAVEPEENEVEPQEQERKVLLLNNNDRTWSIAPWNGSRNP